jgi:hypothetical protein
MGAPVEAAKLLKEVSSDALERCPETEIQRLQSTGALNSGFFERLALVELSDPKRIEEIGTKWRADGRLRATYLKLSATSVEVLRLDDFGWCSIELLRTSDPFIEPLCKYFMEKQLYLFRIHAFSDTGCDFSDFRLYSSSGAPISKR